MSNFDQRHPVSAFDALCRWRPHVSTKAGHPLAEISGFQGDNPRFSTMMLANFARAPVPFREHMANYGLAFRSRRYSVSRSER